MRKAFLISLALLAPVITFAVEEVSEPVTKTHVWPDGTRYVGGVFEGKRKGKGTIFWQDGTRFVGQFVNDMRNGPGTMILPDGTVYTGLFKDDELVGSPAESTSSTAGIDPEERPVPSANKPITELTDDVRQQLIETVDLWGAAWSDRNVPQYLSHYSEDFVVPGKLDRNSWEGLRRSRLTSPMFINVTIAHENIKIVGPDTADVYFKQTYRSNTYSDVTSKQLRLRKEGHTWMILTERSR
jgi:hypothetical protein